MEKAKTWTEINGIEVMNVKKLKKLAKEAELMSA